jgi:two-component system chemotaxis response regulator CheB
VLAAGTRASIDRVALVASTGGPPVVAELLSGMPAHAPPAVVAQHLSPSLARGFAGWLTRAAGRPVQVVSRPAPLAPGTIYVAEDAHHLRVRADTVEPVQAAPGEIAANGDLLLRSVAASFGARAFAAVLTGMGRDGAAGLRALRDAGGWTVAQDRESSVVHGMPRAAEEAGGCREVLPLALIRARLEQLWQRGGATST